MTDRDIQAENTALRAIAAKVMPCHYCGVDQIAKCPHGFPGCSLMDDVMVGQAAVSAEIVRLRADVESANAAAQAALNQCALDQERHREELATAISDRGHFRAEMAVSDAKEEAALLLVNEWRESIEAIQKLSRDEGSRPLINKIATRMLERGKTLKPKEDDDAQPET